MSRTQLSNTQILEGSLTGADLNEGIGIYDETSDYFIDDHVLWQTSKYTCINNVMGGMSGDLSNAPDISTDWVLTNFDGGYF